jgi:hypothetical protein
MRGSPALVDRIEPDKRRFLLTGLPTTGRRLRWCRAITHDAA